jgi:hypothetical protein
VRLEESLTGLSPSSHPSITPGLPAPIWVIRGAPLQSMGSTTRVGRRERERTDPWSSRNPNHDRMHRKNELSHYLLQDQCDLVWDDGHTPSVREVYTIPRTDRSDGDALGKCVGTRGCWEVLYRETHHCTQNR